MHSTIFVVIVVCHEMSNLGGLGIIEISKFHIDKYHIEGPFMSSQLMNVVNMVVPMGT